MKYFPVFYSNEDIIHELSLKEAGSVFYALIENKEKEEALACLTGKARIVFMTLYKEILRSGDYYEEVCERNRENGKKGGRPKKVSEKNRKTEGLKPLETASNSEKAESEKHKIKTQKPKEKAKEKEKEKAIAKANAKEIEKENAIANANAKEKENENSFDLKFDIDDSEVDKREKDLSSDVKTDTDSCDSEDDKRKKNLSSNLKADVEFETDKREENKSSDEKNGVNEEPRFDISKYGDINDPNSDFDYVGYARDIEKYANEKIRLAKMAAASANHSPTPNLNP